ncbi:MAG: glycosyltransferase family 2 protein [Phycisphaerales bacterium]|nr:glycosyltransferase family 2 protein [Phycisphaerales bacterium]
MNRGSGTISGTHHNAAAAASGERAAPVRVEVGDGPGLRAPSIAVLMVTWNRKGPLNQILGSLARQTYPVSRLDLVVVDNASTDGTLEALAERWRPERIVENPTRAAHEPEFSAPRGTGPGPNLGGFRSFTVVRNHVNFGGCGGFNTAFAYADRVLDGADRTGIDRPDYVWLVDDDADLPPDALERLVETAERDASVGIVGSRTVDMADRETTIETTIYFDHERGLMSDEPGAEHRLAASHREWIAKVGATKGRRSYSGLRDVDVVSACSLLARWSGVKKVGFWDYRYFIYCDDADWCLRFAKAGYRVVLNLDALVYHTPWHHKLTPARAYYAQRNMLWLLQKLLPAGEVKRVTLRRLGGALKDGLHAALHRRLFHAEIYRRTAADVTSTRWGKLDNDGPAPEDVVPGLERIGALRAGRTIAVMCGRHESPRWADELRAKVSQRLAELGRDESGPDWVYIIRNDIPDPTAGLRDEVTGKVAERVVYSFRKRSKMLRRQVGFFFSPPTAVVVFDQSNDFPLYRGAWNVHIDRRQPGKAQIERDGLGPRLAYAARWLPTAVSSVLYAWRVGPYVPKGRYG